MYGYIYKTTNLVNGKIYIGKKESSVIDENYWGSGKYFKRAFKKYGLNNFKREILEWASTSEELNQKEKKWIAFYGLPNLKIGYNISLGGDGGNTWINYSQKQKNKRNKKRLKTLENNGTSSKGKTIVNNKKINKQIAIEELSNYLSKGWEKGSLHKGFKATEETRKKLSESHKNKCPGNKNKICIINEKSKQRKFIDKQDLNIYVLQGWKKGSFKGRKASTETIQKLRESHKGQKAEKGRISIHKEGKEKHVLPFEYLDYINAGWEKGRSPRTEEHKLNLSKANKGQISNFKGTSYIQNGIIEKRVKKEELENYLNRGWKKGRLKNA